MDTVFAFDVTLSSHARLQADVVDGGVLFDPDPWVRVLVAAESWWAAELVAFEMAALLWSRWDPDVMVTGIYPRL